MSTNETLQNADTWTLANCYTNIGNILSNDSHKDYKGAIKSYRRALKVQKGLNPICHAVANLHDKIAGILLTKMSNGSDAYRELSIAQSIRNQLGTQEDTDIQIDDEFMTDDSLDSCYKKIGDIHKKRNNHVDAVAYYRKALDAHQQVNQVSQAVADLHDEIALILLAQLSDKRGAHQELSKAESIRNQLAQRQDSAITPPIKNEDNIVVIEEQEEVTILEDTKPRSKTQVVHPKKKQDQPNEPGKVSSSDSRQSTKATSTSQNQSCQSTSPISGADNRLLVVATDASKKGQELLQQGDLDGALAAHQRALTAYKRSSSDSSSAPTELMLSIASEHNHIGVILSKKQKHADDALEEHRKALRIQQDVSPESSHVAKTCSLIGAILYKKGDYDSSRQNYERAAAITRKISDPSKQLAILYYKTGCAFDEIGESDSALRNYKLAAEVAEELDPDSSDLAELYDIIGEVLEMREMVEEATVYFQKALVIFIRLDLTDDVDSMQQKIREISKKRESEAPAKPESPISAPVDSPSSGETVGGVERRYTNSHARSVVESDDEECESEYSGDSSLIDTSFTRSPSRRARRVTFTPSVAGSVSSTESCASSSGELGHKRTRESSNEESSLQPATKKQKNSWTGAEMKILRENRAAGVSYGRISKLLPGRTSDAVASKCRKHGIVPLLSISTAPDTFDEDVESLDDSSTERVSKVGSWTDSEDRVLRKSRLKEPKVPFTEIAKLLNRNENVCRSRASQLGITQSRPKQHRAKAVIPPTVDEDDLDGSSQLLVPSRPRPWTVRDEQILREGRMNDPPVPYRVIAKRLNRTESACSTHASELGLTKPSENVDAVPASRTARANLQQPYWTAEEDRILKDCWKRNLSLEETAEQIPGRSTGACSARASKLGLSRPSIPKQAIAEPSVSKNPKVSPWTIEEDAILRAENAHGRFTIDQIAELLPGRTEKECRRRLVRLLSRPKTTPSSRASCGEASTRNGGNNVHASISRNGHQLSADDIRLIQQSRLKSFARSTFT